ncbi:membrane-bound ClpP family serine protease [Cytobacillus eiseniae]|uniref:Membrane-bound ClpP family serine protease n=1 Tax=Cytobacillus eiseniae TaxID=762947 RepID=A0ABS4RIR4_9BACI|nr:NfeD family protein [Cytobacillus eiseniae]MBP2242791.1 membrane-bound ClpP family serine protease [Cytobacillus eiseniae]
MELFGIPIQTLYLYVLVISGSLIILYLFFGDMVEGLSEAAGFLHPVLVLAFFTFLSAIGYLLESLTGMNGVLIFVIAALTSLILDTLLNIFVLIPLANTEESLVYTEESLKGRIATVIIPIPQDGFGEILIESISGRISKPASSFDNTTIEEGKKVLVIDVKDGVLFVVPRNEY